MTIINKALIAKKNGTTLRASGNFDITKGKLAADAAKIFGMEEGTTGSLFVVKADFEKEKDGRTITFVEGEYFFIAD